MYILLFVLYAFSKQSFKSKYHCARCEQFVCLLAGCSIGDGREVEKIGTEVGNWITVRKKGREKRVIEASQQLKHPKSVQE